MHEKFLTPSIPDGFYWYNEPKVHRSGSGLEIHTDPYTDFWQRTHYGFERDNGHCLFTKLSGDFSLQTRVEFQPNAQYDQCGLMIRSGPETWIKTAVEFENADLSRMGSVVTNLSFSDWATQDIASSHHEAWYRINRSGSDFLLEFALDGESWKQMRIAHLHVIGVELEVGPYACSPTGQGFGCRFDEILIDESSWSPGEH
jgi:regulation of enolase protein 1 (concanavalin A-like superfamily)